MKQIMFSMVSPKAVSSGGAEVCEVHDACTMLMCTERFHVISDSSKDLVRANRNATTT